MGRIPQFGDGDHEWLMENVTDTPETARIKEHMQISLDFIRYLQQNGWLPEGQVHAEVMEAAWMQVWNDYAEIRSAIEGIEVRQDLFGRPPAKYLPGSRNMQVKDLYVGDCVKSHNGSKPMYRVAFKESNGDIHFQACINSNKGKTRYEQTPWQASSNTYLGGKTDINKMYEYAGRDIWTP